MTLRWVPGWNGLTEPEAVSYVAAVEAADGEPLEYGVARAINDFVLGCKNDGIWDAIKASCILAGARTLNGALVPLVGTAPTNVSGLFVAGDYNRETGLVGDGSTKYLNTGRANNADPQDSHHLSVYKTAAGAGTYIGAPDSQVGSGAVRSRNSTAITVSTVANLGLLAVNRRRPSDFVYRINGTNFTSTVDGIFPNLYAGRFYDLNNATYYVDPASNSRMNGIALVGTIYHDGDTDTYLNFNGANSFEVVTGNAQRLLVNNTYVLANNQMRSPIYYDNNNTAYYGNFASTSQMAQIDICLLYTSPSPRDKRQSRMPSSA